MEKTTKNWTAGYNIVMEYINYDIHVYDVGYKYSSKKSYVLFLLRAVA